MPEEEKERFTREILCERSSESTETAFGGALARVLYAEYVANREGIEAVSFEDLDSREKERWTRIALAAIEILAGWRI